MSSEQLIKQIRKAKESSNFGNIENVGFELKWNIMCGGVQGWHRDVLDVLLEVNVREAWHVIQNQFFTTPEDIQKYTPLVFEGALEQNDLYSALQLAEKLQDEDLLRKLGDAGKKQGDYNSFLAFSDLGDIQGMREVLENSKGTDRAAKYAMAIGYLRETGLNQALVKQWQEQDARLEINSTYLIIQRDIVPAYELASQYDFTVGIARGGLSSAILFESFDLPSVACRVSGENWDRKFTWLDDEPEVKGKKILLLDKDVRSGSTLRTVLPYLDGAKQVDLYTNHDPPQTNLESIPTGIGEIYYPERFTLDKFVEATDSLIEKIL